MAFYLFGFGNLCFFVDDFRFNKINNNIYLYYHNTKLYLNYKNNQPKEIKMKALTLAVLALTLTTPVAFAAPTLKVIDDFTSAPISLTAKAKPPYQGIDTADYQPVANFPASRAANLRLGNAAIQMANYSTVTVNPQESVYIGSLGYKTGAFTVQGDMSGIGAATQYDLSYVFAPQAVTSTSYISVTYTSPCRFSGSFAFTVGKYRYSESSSTTFFFKGIAGEVKEMRIPVSSFVSSNGALYLPPLKTISSFTVAGYLSGQVSISILSVKIMSGI